MVWLAEKRVFAYLVALEVLLAFGIAESGSNFTCLETGNVPHPNNLRRKFCMCRERDKLPVICYTCPEGEIYSSRSRICVSSKKTDWDFICRRTGHVAHPSIRRSFCSCKNKTKPPIFCYLCKEGEVYDAVQDACSRYELSLLVPSPSSDFARLTFSTAVRRTEDSGRATEVASSWQHSSTGSSSVYSNSVTALSRVSWTSRTSVAALPGPWGTSADLSRIAVVSGFRMTVENQDQESVLTPTTIPTVSKPLTDAPHGGVCSQVPVGETLQCYKGEIERLIKNLGNIHSKDAIQRVLEKLLSDARDLLKLCSSQKDWRNGFDIIEVLDNIERRIAMWMFHNSWQHISAVTKDLVVDMTLTNGSHEFPSSILKRTLRQPWGQECDVFIMTENMLAKEQYPRLAVISWYRNLHKFVPSNVHGFNESFEVNSHVISAFLYPPITTSFNGEVIIILKHIKALKDGEFPICAFWNFSVVTSSGRGTWSPFGCHVDSKISNKTHTACCCTHLTNFAILMGSDQSSILSEDDKLALSVITYVGCALSLFGAAGAMASVIVFTGLTSDRNIIHANLLTALTVAQIIFLAGIDETENEVRCKLTAILLHYFYLVSFGWMLCEGLHLYCMIIKVFNLSSKMYYYVIFAWGIPAIVVLISAGTRYKEYGTSSSCWISNEVYIQLAFIVPIGVTLLANVAILCLVIKEICTLQRTGKSHVGHFLKSSVKTLVVLVPLLGITWVFGLLLFATKELVFQYLFALFNTAQGFFIFLLHYIFNSEVRNKFHRRKESLKDLRAIRCMRRRLSCSVAPLTPINVRETSLLERVATFHVTSDSSSKKAAS